MQDAIDPELIYRRQIAAFDPLDDATVRALYLRWKTQADLGARAELIERTLPLVAIYARRHRWRFHPVPLPDLIQAGNVGLLLGLDRFDLSRSPKLWPYCCLYVQREMEDATFDYAVVKIARNTDQDRRQRQRPVRSVEAIAAAHPRWWEQLRVLTTEPWQELAAWERPGATAAVIAQVRQALDGLPGHERTVMRCLLGLDGPVATLAEIGQALGMHLESVRRIQRRAAARLRCQLTPPPVH